MAIDTPTTEQSPNDKRGWAMAAVVLVLLLLAYPAARWMTRPAAPAAGATALSASYDAFTAGRYQDSITSAKTAMAAEPELAADAYNNIAVAYWKLGQLDEGIKAAQEALRLKPDYPLARNNLAGLLADQTASRAAAAAAASAMPLDAAAALLTASLQHAQAGRFTECIDTATESAKRDPASARAFNNIAFCAASLQRWDDAIRNAQEAIRLAPDLQLAKNNLAWAQQEKAKAGRTPDR